MLPALWPGNDRESKVGLSIATHKHGFDMVLLLMQLVLMHVCCRFVHLCVLLLAKEVEDRAQCRAHNFLALRRQSELVHKVEAGAKRHQSSHCLPILKSAHIVEMDIDSDWKF